MPSTALETSTSKTIFDFKANILSGETIWGDVYEKKGRGVETLPVEYGVGSGKTSYRRQNLS